jgi:ATP-dependent DNA helicase RecG
VFSKEEAGLTDKLLNVTVHQLSLQSAPRLPNIEEVLAKLQDGIAASELEGQQLDFKEAAGNVKATLAILADAAVCFANADGGRIVLGVNDKAKTRMKALVGISADYTSEVVRRGVFDRTSPPLTLVVDERLEDGNRLLVIDVPPGVAPHSNSGGLATRRLGKECRPFTPAQQREFLVARGQYDWSADSSGIDLRKVSTAEMERLRELLLEAGSDELARLRDKPLLESLRLVATDGRLTMAGVLLVGKEASIIETVPSYGYSYQYRPSPGSEATQRIRGTKPLLSAVESLMEAIAARTEVQPLNIAGGVQLRLVDYPPNAVRELLVNALIHRGFEDGGTVDIEHSPERLVITSPGALVAGVTPANILTHPSTPRHRLLAEAVARCQLAERTGQGIDRAYREMLRAGKKPPQIEDLESRVRASLSGGIGNDAFIHFVRDLPPELGGDVDVLIALSLLRDAKTVDALKLSEAIQRSPVEAQEVLTRISDGESGLLEPTRRTIRKPFPTYRLQNQPLVDLSRAVSYRRRTLDGIDEKVVDNVIEYGFVTNKTLQRLFDIDVYAARNMLTDLRDRDVLEKIGEARGGPGVKYGPGKKFPKKRRP